MLIGIVLGVVTGFLFPEFSDVAKMISTMFINLIKMVIAPVIFISIVLGICGAGDLSKIGRVGLKGLIYFEIVTTAAIIIGLVAGNVIKPGEGISNIGQSSDYVTTENGSVDWTEFITHIIPDNVVNSFAKGDIITIESYVKMLFKLLRWQLLRCLDPLND